MNTFQNFSDISNTDGDLFSEAQIDNYEKGRKSRLYSYAAVSAIFGLLAFLFGSISTEYGALLTAVSVLTGFFFALSFVVFDKSKEIRNDSIISNNLLALVLSDQLRRNVNLAGMSSFGVTALLVVSVVFSKIFRHVDFAITFDSLSTGAFAAGFTFIVLLGIRILAEYRSLYDVLI